MQNKVGLIPILICLLLTGSCTSPALLEQTPVKTDAHSSLLWRISGNDLQQDSWLFGTIHFIEKEHFFIRPEADSVFGLCEQVVFEIPLNDLSMYARMENLLKLEANQSLKDFLTPAEYDELSNWLSTELGMELDDYLHYKPLKLYQTLIPASIKGDVASYEMEFLKMAVRGDKSMTGLESLEDQMAIFDSIPYKVQMQWILQGLQEEQDIMQSMNELTEAYLNEDLRMIDSLLIQSSPELEEYSNLMLYDRNERWVNALPTLLSEHACFIAVGAGHLPGEGGLIALLRDRGYTVEPL